MNVWMGGKRLTPAEVREWVEKLSDLGKRVEAVPDGMGAYWIELRAIGRPQHPPIKLRSVTECAAVLTGRTR